MSSRARIGGAIAATGLLLFATGYFSAAVQPNRYVASTLVRVERTGADGAPLTAEQANRFVQSTILVFNTHAFTNTIARRFPSASELDLKLEQIGTTDIVDVRATAERSRVAVQAADAAANAMVEQITQRATSEVVESAAARPRVADRVAPGTRLKSLQRLVDRVGETAFRQGFRAAASAHPGPQARASVAVPAAAEGTEKAVSPLQRALLFGLLGLIGAVAVAIVRRRPAEPTPRTGAS